MPKCVLGMIRGLFPHAEHKDVFMLFKRHSVGVEKSPGLMFKPHELVGKLAAVGFYQSGSEETLACQDDVACGLDDTAVFLPEIF